MSFARISAFLLLDKRPKKHMKSISLNSKNLKAKTMLRRLSVIIVEQRNMILVHIYGAIWVKTQSGGLIVSANATNHPPIAKENPLPSGGGRVKSWVLYVDLPGGQVSFHSAERYAGSDYTGEWDGKHLSAERIIRFAQDVIDLSKAGGG